jgi:hypothetical protein
MNMSGTASTDIVMAAFAAVEGVSACFADRQLAGEWRQSSFFATGFEVPGCSAGAGRESRASV